MHLAEDAGRTPTHLEEVNFCRLWVRRLGGCSIQERIRCSAQDIDTVRSISRTRTVRAHLANGRQLAALARELLALALATMASWEASRPTPAPMCDLAFKLKHSPLTNKPVSRWRHVPAAGRRRRRATV